MKTITSKDELFSHFESMGEQNSVSTITIPEVGRFRILYQELETPESESASKEKRSGISQQEELKQWDQVLMLIQQKISRAAFETWFKGTSAIKLDDQHIRVICSNNFSMDWLEKNYENDIITSLEEVTGEIFSLEFSMEEPY